MNLYELEIVIIKEVINLKEFSSYIVLRYNGAESLSWIKSFIARAATTGCPDPEKDKAPPWLLDGRRLVVTKPGLVRPMARFYANLTFNYEIIGLYISLIRSAVEK